MVIKKKLKAIYYSSKVESLSLGEFDYNANNLLQILEKHFDLEIHRHYPNNTKSLEEIAQRQLERGLNGFPENYEASIFFKNEYFEGEITPYRPVPHVGLTCGTLMGAWGLCAGILSCTISPYFAMISTLLLGGFLIAATYPTQEERKAILKLSRMPRIRGLNLSIEPTVEAAGVVDKLEETITALENYKLDKPTETKQYLPKSSIPSKLPKS